MSLSRTNEDTTDKYRKKNLSDNNPPCIYDFGENPGEAQIKGNGVARRAVTKYGRQWTKT